MAGRMPSSSGEEEGKQLSWAVCPSRSKGADGLQRGNSIRGVLRRSESIARAKGPSKFADLAHLETLKPKRLPEFYPLNMCGSTHR
jgi:hypothetical protein